MNNQTAGWLTVLGNREIALTKLLGFDHFETVAVRQEFAEAYKTIQKIRNAYNQSQLNIKN